MSSECIFCNPPADLIISDSQEGIAMVYPSPMKVGHVVVAVKSHKPFLHDVTEQEAGAMFELANRISKLIVEYTQAEKVYVAAVGDSDKHFHVHLLPKLKTNVNVGPYIFGPNGWASGVREDFKDAQVQKFINKIKMKLSEE